jgi:hypothetical protein
MQEIPATMEHTELFDSGNKVPSDTTDLGLAILMVEAPDGASQPVAVVATLREAREIAQSDLARRTKSLGSAEKAVCPAGYTVWVRNGEGEYIRAAEIW